MAVDVDKHKAFAQELVKTMRVADATALDITYRLTDDGCFEQGRMTYSRGRHGTEGVINLVVTTHIGNFKEEL